MAVTSLVLATLLVGTTVAPAASASTVGPAVQGGIVRDEAAELQVLRDLQVQNRIADGVPAQTWSTNLAGVARRWAHRMAEDSSRGAGPAAMVHSTTDENYYFASHINQSFS